MSHHTWVNSVLIYPSTEAPRGSRGPGLWPFPYPSPAVDPIIRGLEQRAEPRCLLPSPLEQPMWKAFYFVCWLIGLVWFLHPILIHSYLVQPDHGNAGWRKSLGERKCWSYRRGSGKLRFLCGREQKFLFLMLHLPSQHHHGLGNRAHSVCGSDASPALSFSVGGNVLLAEFLLQAWP